MAALANRRAITEEVFLDGDDSQAIDINNLNDQQLRAIARR